MKTFSTQLPERGYVLTDSGLHPVIGRDCWGEKSFRQAFANALAKSPPATIGFANVVFRERVYGPFLLNLRCFEVEGYPVVSAN